MSDSESNAQPHATTGGKSLAATLDRRPYKSYRKKYRKLHHKFDAVFDENKRLFKEEQKLEGIARRLREELDGLLELLLDLNQNPALPPNLRFDVSLPTQHTAIGGIPSVVDADITPQSANEMFTEYTNAVQRGQIPHLDLHVIREQIDEKLRLHGVRSLESLESSITHTRPDLDGPLPDEVLGENPPGLLTSEQEDAYLLRLDARLGDPPTLARLRKDELPVEERHWAEMTAREVERQVELLNPQSQHNWLKTHARGGGEMDDNESLIDSKPAPTKKRNLAKQVGDRAVGRAREGMSPSAGSDEGEEGPRKGRGRDVDGTYRVKGGKNGSATKGKRKRASGEDGSVAAIKRTKQEG